MCVLIMFWAGSLFVRNNTRPRGGFLRMSMIVSDSFMFLNAE